MELKIDGLDLELVSKNASGPLGWMTEGTFDIDMKFFIPRLPAITEDSDYHPPTYHELWYPGSLILRQYSDWLLESNEEEQPRTWEIESTIRLHHIKLNPPLYSPDISWLNNALIHPIARHEACSMNKLTLN